MLDQPHRNGAYHDRRANHAVHVKGMQPEHFLDAEPTDDLRFDESDAEDDPYGKVFEIVPPGMLQLRLIGTHGVGMTHILIAVFHVDC